MVHTSSTRFLITKSYNILCRFLHLKHRQLYLPKPRSKTHRDSRFRVGDIVLYQGTKTAKVTSVDNWRWSKFQDVWIEYPSYDHYIRCCIINYPGASWIDSECSIKHLPDEDLIGGRN